MILNDINQKALLEWLAKDFLKNNLMVKKKATDNPNWYTKYYKAHYGRKNKFRDDLLNSETLYQYLALKKCFVNSLYKISLNKKESRIIDIGCGSATQLINLVSLGFNQDNLFGIDINKVDIDFAQRNYPLLNLSWQDATNLNFKNNYFDLTYESTMFVQITNSNISQKIANEMIRITKKGGYLILFDWRYGKFNNANFLACNKRRIKELFKVDKSTKLISIEKGMLIPPIGRFLSKNMSSMYFVFSRLFPFFIGQVAYVLQKK